MELTTVIKKRRSIRRYKSDLVSDEVVNEIINQAVSYAPSAKNIQPWKFLVIRNEKLKNEVIGLCKGNKFLHEAPILIVALANEEECYQVNAGYMRSDLIDIGSVMTHLILLATDYGLGSCWIGAFEGEKMNNLLGVEKPWRIVALTPLGVPAEDGRYYPRKAINEVVEWIK